MGRGHCYLALDAKNRTKAIAISRMKTIRMATALLIRLRRAERMVEGQPCRSVMQLFSTACNLFPHACTKRPRFPMTRSAAFFISFLLAIRIAWNGVRRGVSPSPAAGYEAERIYTAYAGLREFGTASDKYPARPQRERIHRFFFNWFTGSAL